jgi:hypothetical protein
MHLYGLERTTRLVAVRVYSFAAVTPSAARRENVTMSPDWRLLADLTLNDLQAAEGGGSFGTLGSFICPSSWRLAALLAAAEDESPVLEGRLALPSSALAKETRNTRLA